jgi:hypothetical protein
MCLIFCLFYIGFIILLIPTVLGLVDDRIQEFAIQTTLPILWSIIMLAITFLYSLSW